jgi:hypothetical protein
MEHHDTIVLEEPPDDGFRKMLSGKLSIDDYLTTLDIEYPEFARRMSEALRDFAQSGKKALQIEPYMERLLEIHQFFAENGRPDQLKKASVYREVYEAERAATKTLLDFYSVSMRNNFDETLAAVKRFARADADRFRLRDRMRATEIACTLTKGGRFYIEAGLIHFPLRMDLKRSLPPRYPLRIHFLTADAAHAMGYRGNPFGPGDILTLLYRLHPERSFRNEDQLAGRALIHNKLLVKEEMSNSGHGYPHLKDEWETALLVRSLTTRDCRVLYPYVRKADPETAKEMVLFHLRKKGK